jgi:hypothetical protein
VQLVRIKSLAVARGVKVLLNADWPRSQMVC